MEIDEHEIDARDPKLGAEEITRDIPNVSEEVLADLEQRGMPDDTRVIRGGESGRTTRAE